MLSNEENELITRVGPATPMGQLMRRYWVPALLSAEIPAPDCPPVKVRLLGENLVAFRDSSERVGLLGELCAHRRACLFYGRNEEGGLRCVYHGWKYDVEGNVLETPAEPANSNLKNKVRQKAYPCKEKAGVVFTYMGPGEKVPPFPDYEWFKLPPEHIGVTKFVLDCNYLQALEGDCDSAHAPFLHRGNRGGGLLTSRGLTVSYEVRDKWFGVKAAAVRPVGSAEKHVRVHSFAMPFIACVPTAFIVNGKPDGYLVVYQTPADDYHTSRYNFRFKRSEPVTEQDFEFDRSQLGLDFRLLANHENNYLIDRQKQRTSNYTGIEGFATQDACMTESMGAVCDRSEEHLGVTDAFVIAVRRFLLRAVRDVQAGSEAPGLINNFDKNELAEINSYERTVPLDAAWD
jgi:phthalate 4,5-dioxygenase oxygenase subunit